MPSARQPTEPGGGGSALSSAGEKRGRETFAAFELAKTLSRYDLGVIEDLKEYPRGSRKAPKVLIKSAAGIFLLKRRAPGKDDPYKVAFTHSLQLHLAQRQFPLPHLIGTRDENNSMLQLDGAIYELFEYIRGTPYDHSLEATTHAGQILGLFHKLLADFSAPYDAAVGSYHRSRTVSAAFARIPDAIAKASPDASSEQLKQINAVTETLRKTYDAAADAVDAQGLAEWPKQITHCDWHPGNMLFRGAAVVAVIDFDAARLQPRIVDVANGALQFSAILNGPDPSQWPDYIDESRFKRFLRAYDAVPGATLSRAEIAVIPSLMIEALIAESVIPVANTGSFERIRGALFLQRVCDKARWLADHADRLIHTIEAS
jgi:homoserine kinase type II